MRSHWMIGILLFPLLAGCTQEDYGPVLIRIVDWRQHEDSTNVTLTTRIVNTGDQPAWRIEIYVRLTYYTVNGETKDGRVVDPRGDTVYMYRGLLGAHEVLRPKSYVDRTVEITFDAHNPLEPKEEKLPLPRYDPRYSIHYETPDRAWIVGFTPCDRLPSGEAIRSPTCPIRVNHRAPSAGDPDYEGRPNDTTEVGEPIPHEV